MLPILDLNSLEYYDVRTRQRIVSKNPVFHHANLIIREKIMDIKPTPKSIIGMLLIIFAIIDFLVGWIGGGDIFSFLPWYISMFTPIIIGGIGFGMLEHRKQKKK